MKALKTWPLEFRAVMDGDKTAEFRKNDREFKKGDYLRLLEFDPQTNLLSGQFIDVTVKHIVHGPAFGIPEGYCMMSIWRHET